MAAFFTYPKCPRAIHRPRRDGRTLGQASLSPVPTRDGSEGLRQILAKATESTAYDGTTAPRLMADPQAARSSA